MKGLQTRTQLLFHILFLLTWSPLFSQRGDHFVRNYLPHEYEASSNNSGICQNDEGLIFVANNNGVLIYDGRNWERCEHDEVSMSAIGRTAAGVIVAGTVEGDIATIEKDARGRFTYRSLFGTLPAKQRPQEIIRQIVTVDDITYFISSDALVEYRGGNLRIYRPQGSFHPRLMVMGHHVYLIDTEGGLFALDHSILRKIPGTDSLATEKFFFCYPTVGYHHAVGFRGIGIMDFLYNPAEPLRPVISRKPSPCDQAVIESEINNGCLLRNHNFIVTTNKNGAFELNRELKVVRRYDTKNGVYENNIKSAFQDANGNLWLALFYGLSYVEINTNLYTYGRSKGISGPVESAAYYKQKLFIATDKGLQYYDSLAQNFRQYSDFNLQSWYLLPYNGELLVGTQKGLYSIVDEQYTQVSSLNTHFIYRDPVHPEVIYAGTDNGVDVYYYSAGYNLIRTINTGAAVKSMAADSLHNIYFSTDDSRLYFFNYDSDFRLDSVSLNGVVPKDNLANYLFRFGEQVLLGTDVGIFKLERKNSRQSLKVRKHPLFSALTDSSVIFRASQFRDGIICSRKSLKEIMGPSEEKIVLIEKQIGKPDYQLSIINHLNKVRPNFIHYDSSSRIMLIAANEGLFLLDNRTVSAEAEHRMVVKYILNGNDTLVSNITSAVTDNKLLVLPYSRNELLFMLGFTGYELNNIEFSYTLEGREEDYHRWNKSHQVQLTGIREGSYVLRLMARSETNDQVYSISIPFTILPPWYRTWWAYVIYTLLFLLVVVAAVIIYNKRLVEQNRILEETVEERTRTVKEQKQEIEHKQQEIMDSINYAQRIQRALLATDKLLKQNLPDYFVHFQPKDIVSGDFYWAAELNDGRFVLATADSTGHGVPGAIMSMLNISCLTDSVEAKGLSEPAEILNATRCRIISYLKNDGSAEGGKDGMDCSLIRFDFKNKKMSYAAANNPVWIVRFRDVLPELIELNCDKMPVGKHDRDQTGFTQYEFDLQTGDMVYAITDGFPDQFGGPKGKKFMYRQLKETLQAMAHLKVSEQSSLLGKIFADWKGDLEQVDDVTIIGVRVL